MSSLLVVACKSGGKGGSAAGPVDGEPPAVAPMADCTLATPLASGVPGSPGHLIASDRNPNGVSELAALMRIMQSDLENARSEIPKGAPVAPMLERHRKIRCAWPTDKADRNAAFDGRAEHYLSKVGAFDATRGADRARAYDDVVGACRACHETTCSGVLDAIDKLRITPAL